MTAEQILVTEDNVRFSACALLAAVVLSGCQLPERQVMPPRNQAPDAPAPDVKASASDAKTLPFGLKPPAFDAKAFVRADSGVFAEGLAKIPGAICIPDEQGYCDAAHTYPGPYLKPGTKISLTSGTDTAPAYDSIIDSKYKPSKNYPFLAPTDDEETLREVKAYVIEKASIAPAIEKASTAPVTDKGSAPGPNDQGTNGFPGAAAILDGLRKDHGLTLKAGTIIYWITAAQLVSVTEDEYAKVPDMYEVQGVGFGSADATFNAKGPTKQTAWLGIQAVKIHLVLPSEPGGSAELAASAPLATAEQIFDVDETGKIKSGGTAAK